jgi:hypothetical protein
MYIIGGYLAAGDVPAVPTGNLPPGGIAAMFFFYLWTAFYAVSWNGESNFSLLTSISRFEY